MITIKERVIVKAVASLKNAKTVSSSKQTYTKLSSSDKKLVDDNKTHLIGNPDRVLRKKKHESKILNS